jgi:hypothetical protein
MWGNLMIYLAVQVMTVLVFFSSHSVLGSVGNHPPHLNCPSTRLSVSPTRPDPLLHQSWHLDRIGAFEAWKISQGDPHITIAFVDSGINYNHPDLI